VTAFAQFHISHRNSFELEEKKCGVATPPHFFPSNSKEVWCELGEGCHLRATICSGLWLSPATPQRLLFTSVRNLTTATQELCRAMRRILELLWLRIKLANRTKVGRYE